MKNESISYAEEIINLLLPALNKINKTKNFNTKLNSLDEKITTIINYIFDKRNIFNDLAPCCIKNKGEILKNKLSEISNINENSNFDYEELFSILFVFMTEMLTRHRSPFENNKELEKIREFAVNNFNHFNENSRNLISKTIIELPINIIERIIDNPQVNLLSTFSKEIKELEESRIKWDGYFKSHKKYIEEMRNVIRNLKSEFSFVGIVQGFKNIQEKKLEELSKTYSILLILAAVMLFPPIVHAFIASPLSNTRGDNLISIIYYILPTIAFELLILYFFRVTLQQYKSIQAQLLQIDLRVSLCQFIEGYHTYKKDNLGDNSNSLDKFETLIFSGIVSDSGAIPSTFDGLEKITALFKNTKSGEN